ncbi:hypothetical protein HDU98_005488 [Podochytrium sp. JEL0797]|nr:hypothetical protein HDU98_005488 [Podochytrium sp. JEL0797]
MDRQSRVASFIKSYQSTVGLVTSSVLARADSGFYESVVLWDRDATACVGVVVEEYSSPSTRVGSPETVQVMEEERSLKKGEGFGEGEEGEAVVGDSGDPIVVDPGMECVSPEEDTLLVRLPSPISPEVSISIESLQEGCGISRGLDAGVDSCFLEEDGTGWAGGGEGWDIDDEEWKEGDEEEEGGDEEEEEEEEEIPDYVAELDVKKESEILCEISNGHIQAAKNLYLISYVKLSQRRALRDHFAIGNFMKRLVVDCPQLIAEIEKDRVAFQRVPLRKQLSDHETEVAVVVQGES